MEKRYHEESKSYQSVEKKVGRATVEFPDTPCKPDVDSPVPGSYLIGCDHYESDSYIFPHSEG